MINTAAHHDALLADLHGDEQYSVLGSREASALKPLTLVNNEHLITDARLKPKRSKHGKVS